MSKVAQPVSCKVTDNDMVDWVTFPTWTACNDQDDIIWGEGVINGDEIPVPHFFEDIFFKKH